jgi:hypothetical protein
LRIKGGLTAKVTILVGMQFVARHQVNLPPLVECREPSAFFLCVPTRSLPA